MGTRLTPPSSTSRSTTHSRPRSSAFGLPELVCTPRPTATPAPLATSPSLARPPLSQISPSSTPTMKTTPSTTGATLTLTSSESGSTLVSPPSLTSTSTRSTPRPWPSCPALTSPPSTQESNRATCAHTTLSLPLPASTSSSLPNSSERARESLSNDDCNLILSLNCNLKSF